MAGRSIRIFLVDGTTSGFRTAELSLSTIKALVVPRASLTSVAPRTEMKKTGVYVLVGYDSDNPGRKKIYIGETDTIIDRLSTHNKDADKEFWEEAIVLVSKDDNLTKSHVRSLEARLISLASVAKKATLTNGTNPDGGTLPESDEADMDEFIIQARLLLGALGHDLFEAASTPASLNTEQNKSSAKPPIFKYSGDGFSASCEVAVEAGEFVVRKGSTARIQEANTLTPGNKQLRQQLVQSGVLKKTNDSSYEFTQDYSFKSASAAAQVVSGSTINGLIAWKSETDGKTFGDWQDDSLPVSDDA